MNFVRNLIFAVIGGILGAAIVHFGAPPKQQEIDTGTEEQIRKACVELLDTENCLAACGENTQCAIKQEWWCKDADGTMHEGKKPKDNTSTEL